MCAAVGDHRVPRQSTMVPPNEVVDRLTHHAEDVTRNPHEEHPQRAGGKPFNGHDGTIGHESDRAIYPFVQLTERSTAPHERFINNIDLRAPHERQINNILNGALSY